MLGHHFLSYSTADAKVFAERLYDALMAGPPPIEVWMDGHDLRPGGWDDQAAEAIRTCDSLLFVMTPDSVEDRSICKDEWTWALRYKKPVVPLLLDGDAVVPFRLTRREYVDFTGDFDVAVARLRNHLRWLASPKGVLQALEDRLADAKRDRLRATEPVRIARIDDEIALLKEQVALQERVVADPLGSAVRVEESIARGLERDRPRPTPAPISGPGKFINAPPLVAPPHFQDRHDETLLIGEFLKQDALRMLLVVGRGGIGKTAMVCRLLKSLERGQLPEDGGPLPIDGIVYLSATGSRRLVVPHLFADLCQLLPDDKAGELEALYKQDQKSTAAKIQSLLAAFPGGRVLVLMDNFETIVDGETFAIRDAEIDEALRALLEAPQHSVKAMLTTRVAPRDLERVQPGRQSRIDLQEGLPFPFAENVLRAMDSGGRVGLRDASASDLAEAREGTRGFPRALEALFGILSADRDATLREILDKLAGLQTEEVVEALVGEAYSRLDPTAEKVMQALAVYGRPVPPTAVNFLLQPQLPGVDSSRVLSRLVNTYFARKEAGLYYLHPIDRAYALSRIPRGEEFDRYGFGEPKFTQISLLHRAAEYFEQVRLPRQDWKSLVDLAPQLSEFDLRYEGGDYGSAIEILHEIGHDFMLRWGHFRLCEELHERLHGKLVDPMQKMMSIVGLGICYQVVGMIGKAIAFYEEGLEIARREGNQIAEVTFLGNIGVAYSRISKYSESITCSESVIDICRKIKNPQSEGAGHSSLSISLKALGHLARALDEGEEALKIARLCHDVHDEEGITHNQGNCFLALGQTSLAIAQYERANELNLITKDPDWESNHYGSLAECYLRVGEIARARQCYDRTLALRREIGSRAGEASALEDLALFAIEEGRHREAVGLALESVDIVAELGLPRATGMTTLALAHLCAGDRAKARAAAEAACAYEDANETHAEEHATIGVIALLQGDLAAAGHAFATAAAQAGTMIARCADNFAQLDFKGHALCGLAACGEPADLAEAAEAYSRARVINRDVGVVRKALRWFDTISGVNPAILPQEIRAKASGGGDASAWTVGGWGSAG